MDHPTTIRLKASIQTLVFVILLAATLFGSAGRFDIIEFWVYIAIVVGASVSSLIILDSDLMQERMQPGGHRVGLHFLPLTIVIFLHWAVAGFDHGHLHLSDDVPPSPEVVALALFALAWIVLIWAGRHAGYLRALQILKSRLSEIEALDNHPPGIGIISITSTVALGMVRCGLSAKRAAAASCDSACTIE
jgi:hypothetical protein